MLSAVIEQDQSDGMTRPIGVLSRSTVPNEKNWSTTELECAVIVWAVKKKMPDVLRYIIHRGMQPPTVKEIEILATKVD